MAGDGETGPFGYLMSRNSTMNNNQEMNKRWWRQEESFTRMLEVRKILHSPITVLISDTVYLYLPSLVMWCTFPLSDIHPCPSFNPTNISLPKFLLLGSGVVFVSSLFIDPSNILSSANTVAILSIVYLVVPNEVGSCRPS